MFIVLEEYKKLHDPVAARKSLEYLGVNPSTSREFLPRIREILSKIFDEEI